MYKKFRKNRLRVISLSQSMEIQNQMALIFSFYKASAGYRIGDGWKIYKYCLYNTNFYIDFLWNIFFLSVIVEWTMQTTAYIDQKQSRRNESQNVSLFKLYLSICRPFLISNA